jgi:hypothetical protein
MDSDNLSMEGLAKRACKKESVFTFKGASAQKHAFSRIVRRPQYGDCLSYNSMT